MKPGRPSICEGKVFHRRAASAEHRFTYRVSQIWLDPDRPDEICDLSRWWSTKPWSPVRFDPGDYGDGSSASLAEQVRQDLEKPLGYRPEGEIRMLTQFRRWGWLFNPITVFVAWHQDEDRPVGVVLEVTNTPWKERHRYPVVLEPEDDGWTARFDKELHVSPFLDEDHTYLLALADDDENLRLHIDLVDDLGKTVVATALAVERRAATKARLDRSLLTSFAPTHLVSLGIHLQALRLWTKRVPFVPHPAKQRLGKATP